MSSALRVLGAAALEASPTSKPRRRTKRKAAIDLDAVRASRLEAEAVQELVRLGLRARNIREYVQHLPSWTWWQIEIAFRAFTRTGRVRESLDSCPFRRSELERAVTLFYDHLPERPSLPYILSVWRAFLLGRPADVPMTVQTDINAALAVFRRLRNEAAGQASGPRLTSCKTCGGRHITDRYGKWLCTHVAIFSKKGVAGT